MVIFSSSRGNVISFGGLAPIDFHCTVTGSDSGLPSYLAPLVAFSRRPKVPGKQHPHHPTGGFAPGSKGPDLSVSSCPADFVWG